MKALPAFVWVEKGVQTRWPQLENGAFMRNFKRERVFKGPLMASLNVHSPPSLHHPYSLLGKAITGANAGNRPTPMPEEPK